MNMEQSVTLRLPCNVGDIVWCNIDGHKADYLDECIVKEISIEKDRPEPLFRVVNYGKAEYATFWQSDFGKEVFNAAQYFGRLEENAGQDMEDLLIGSRRLPVAEISFEEDILPEGSCLNFYVPVTFDPADVFGVQLQEDDSINVYANYDPDERRVCNAMDVVVISSKGRESYHKYPLTKSEKTTLESKMEAYSQQLYGKSLAELCGDYQQEQHSPEMRM